MAVMAVTPENVEKVRALARHRAGMYGLDRDDAESEMLYLLALGKLHSDAVRSQVRFRLIDLARRRNGRYVRRDLLTAPITVEQAADFVPERRTDEIGAVDCRVVVAEAVRRLPQRQRDALALYVATGSLRETGEALGVTESRASQLIGPARSKIRAALAG